MIDCKAQTIVEDIKYFVPSQLVVDGCEQNSSFLPQVVSYFGQRLTSIPSMTRNEIPPNDQCSLIAQITEKIGALSQTEGNNAIILPMTHELARLWAQANPTGSDDEQQFTFSHTDLPEFTQHTYSSDMSGSLLNERFNSFIDSFRVKGAGFNQLDRQNIGFILEALGNLASPQLIRKLNTGEVSYAYYGSGFGFIVTVLDNRYIFTMTSSEATIEDLPAFSYTFDISAEGVRTSIITRGPILEP